MGRLLKLIVTLVVLGGLALVGFAYFGDLTPDRSAVSEPVELNAN